MVAIYAVHAGAQIQIGHYGVATVETPALVPEAVATELRGRADLRIEEPPAIDEPKRSRRRGIAEPTSDAHPVRDEDDHAD